MVYKSLAVSQGQVTMVMVGSEWVQCLHSAGEGQLGSFSLEDDVLAWGLEFVGPSWTQISTEVMPCFLLELNLTIL